MLGRGRVVVARHVTASHFISQHIAYRITHNTLTFSLSPPPPVTLPNTPPRSLCQSPRYNFGYLWTVHSLLYWWRDYGRAKHHVNATGSSLRSRSPCYLNYIEPADVGFGGGVLSELSSLLERLFGKVVVADLIADCLAPPDKEIVLPRDL